jgi:hypothetical protein
MSLARPSLEEAAHFKDERGLLVAVVDDLRVRRLAIVFIAETTADAPHAGESSIRRGTSGRCPSDGCPGCRDRHCRRPRSSASRSAGSCG